MKYAALALAFLLAACGGSGPLSNTLGESRIEARFYHPAEIPEAVAMLGPSIQSLDWYDGKEKANVAVSINPATGAVSYTASDVRNVDVARARAELADAFGDDLAKQIEALVPGGLEALVRAFVLP